MSVLLFEEVCVWAVQTPNTSPSETPLEKEVDCHFARVQLRENSLELAVDCFSVRLLLRVNIWHTAFQSAMSHGLHGHDILVQKQKP